jgi:hypothetical protein
MKAIVKLLVQRDDVAADSKANDGDTPQLLELGSLQPFYERLSAESLCI